MAPGGVEAKTWIDLKRHSLQLAVSPYELMADGTSTALIQVTDLGYQALPAANELITFAAPAYGTLSALQVVTGFDGGAQVTYTAPDTAKLGGKQAVNDPIQATNDRHYAAASARVLLRSQAPVIKDVAPRYTGTMLEKVRAVNAYRVKVVWPKNELGSVEFDMNGSKSTVQATGDEVEKTYDMATLKASKSGGDNTLIITAISRDGTQRSEPVTLKPLVVPIPDWLDPGFFALTALGEGSAYRYAARYQTTWKWPDPAYDTNLNIPKSVPWVGGEWGIKKSQVALLGEYDSWTNTAIAGGGFAGNIQIAGKPVSAELTGKVNTVHVLNDGWNLENLELALSGGGKVLDANQDTISCAEIHPVIAGLTKTPVIGPIIEDVLSICTLGVDLGGKVAAKLIFELSKQAPWLIPSKGLITPEGTLKGVLKLELSKSWFLMTFGVGGTSSVDFQPFPGWSIKPVAAKFTAFVEYAVSFLRFSQRGQVPVSWSWPASVAAVPGATQTGWYVAPRDYVGPSYGRFVAPTSDSPQGELAEGAAVSGAKSDTRLVENIYPLTAPALARLPNGDLLLAWTHDDEAKPIMQGEEIYYSVRRGGVWSQPKAITNDTQQDWHPALAVDAAGRVMAAWMRARVAGLTESSKIEDLVPTLEIAYAVYTPTSDTWSAPAYLTDNATVDHTPRLAVATDGRLMVAWVSNAANELLGSAASPDTIRYATWNGSRWSSVGAVASSVAGMSDWGLAYRGNAARLVLARDTDGNLATDGDSELFAATWDGAAWSALARLTNDTVPDRAPQPVYRPDGTIWLFWNRGDDEAMWGGNWNVAPQLVLADASDALQNVTAAQAADDSLALVWTGVANGISSLRYALYDAAQAGWSAPIDLATADPTALSGRAAVVFAPGGRLQMAYISTAVKETQAAIAAAGTGEAPQVIAVPQPGQADLRLLEQTTALDLALGEGDLRATPADARPGQAITLTATLHNRGDLAARGVTVTFYDGDPAAGAVVIAAPASRRSAGRRDERRPCCDVDAAVRREAASRLRRRRDGRDHPRSHPQQ